MRWVLEIAQLDLANIGDKTADDSRHCNRISKTQNTVGFVSQFVDLTVMSHGHDDGLLLVIQHDFTARTKCTE